MDTFINLICVMGIIAIFCYAVGAFSYNEVLGSCGLAISQ